MTDEYAADGVVIAEVNSAMDSQSTLVWWQTDPYTQQFFDYYSFRVIPADTVVSDWEKTQVMTDARVYVLIDLTTMKVIDGNCGVTYDYGEQCVDDNI